MYQKKSVKLSAGKLKKLVEQAKKRDGYKCRICGRTTNLVGHHIYPRGRLRLDILINILTVCDYLSPEETGCHTKITDSLNGLSVDLVIKEYGHDVKDYLKTEEPERR